MDIPNKKTVRADTDGLYYYIEDTEWICWPTDDDPGWLGPKFGAVPTENQVLVR